MQTMSDGTVLPTWGVMVADTLQWIGKVHPLGEGPQCQAEVHANAGLFAASKAMAGLLEEGTQAWPSSSTVSTIKTSRFRVQICWIGSQNGACVPVGRLMLRVCHERRATGSGRGRAGPGYPRCCSGSRSPTSKPSWVMPTCRLWEAETVAVDMRIRLAWPEQQSGASLIDAQPRALRRVGSARRTLYRPAFPTARPVRIAAFRPFMPIQLAGSCGASRGHAHGSEHKPPHCTRPTTLAQHRQRRRRLRPLRRTGDALGR